MFGGIDLCRGDGPPVEDVGQEDIMQLKMEMLETQQQQLQDDLRAELQKQRNEIFNIQRQMDQVQRMVLVKDQEATEQKEKEVPHVTFCSSASSADFPASYEVPIREQESNMVKIDPRLNVSQLEKAHLEYQWKRSMWDSSLFVGTTMMRPSASVALGITFFVYIVLCWGWIQTTRKSLTVPAFDLEGERQINIWRSTVAHDVSLRNAFTQESLAQSVCSEKVYAPYSNLQTLMVMELNEYLGLGEFLGMEFPAGGILAILVVSVWFLTLAKELFTLIDFTSGCCGLSIGRESVFVPEGVGASTIRLVEISYFRAGYWFTTVLLRITLVCCLAYYGTLFLVCESQLRDMLMNAVGLELIMNLDELVFEALLPKSQQSLIEDILPLKYRPDGKRCRHWNSYGQLLIIISVMGISMAIVTINVLSPYIDVLRINHEALCGGVEGSLDFVVAIDAIGVPWAAATKAEGESMGHAMGESITYAMKTVLDVKKYGLQNLENDLHPEQRNNSGAFMHVATPSILQRKRTELPEFRSPVSWELADTANIANVVGESELHILSHEDFGDLQGSVYNNFLRFLLGETKEVTCADVPLAFCYEHGSSRDNVVFRKLCPAWCGCDSPEKGSVSNPYAIEQSHGFIGCSSFNTKRKSFVGKLQELPCNDTTSLDVFETWVQGVGNAVAQGGGLMIDALISDFKEGGCDKAVQRDVGASNICSETSLAAICPTSCGCPLEAGWTRHHAVAFDFCPYSCHFAVRWVTTISVNRSTDSRYGPWANMPCSFPFKYQGTQHDECICEDWPNPWCAITLTSDGSALHWGDCSGSCPN